MGGRGKTRQIIPIQLTPPPGIPTINPNIPRPPLYPATAGPAQKGATIADGLVFIFSLLDQYQRIRSLQEGQAAKYNREICENQKKNYPEPAPLFCGCCVVTTVYSVRHEVASAHRQLSIWYTVYDPVKNRHLPEKDTQHYVSNTCEEVKKLHSLYGFYKESQEYIYEISYHPM